MSSESYYPSAIRGLAWPVMKSSKESTIVQIGPNGTTTRNPQWINPMWDWTLTYEYLKASPYDVQAIYAPYTDYAVLQGFYLAMNGQANDFLFDDPTDDTVGPGVWIPRTYFPAGAIIIDPAGHMQTTIQNGSTGLTAPTFDDSGGITAEGSQRWQDGGLIGGALGQELSLVNDGAGNYYSPLQRNFGGQFLEDITDLNLSGIPLTVWANNVIQNGSGSPLNYGIIGPGVAIPGYSFSGLVIAWTAMPTEPITASFQFFFRVRFDMDQLDFEEFLYQIWSLGGSGSKNGAGYLKLTSSRAPGV